MTDSEPNGNRKTKFTGKSLAPRKFDFGDGETSVRVASNEGGEPLFVAKDVVESVGATWKGTQTIVHVPEAWQGVTTVVTPGGPQNMAILTEEGVNFYLIRSDRPKALPIQKWLAGTVLPAIRRYGKFEIHTGEPAPEPTKLQIARQLVEALEQNERLEVEKTELEEKKKDSKIGRRYRTSHIAYRDCWI